MKLTRNDPSRPATPLLTVAAVATRLDVSTKTVRRLIDHGQLEVLRIGRSLRVSEDDLQAYLRSCR